MADNEASAEPDRLPPLAILLASLAGGADGVHAGRLWTGLGDLLASGPDADPGIRSRLDALRHAPGDSALAVALASSIRDRAAANPTFGSELDRWLAQDQIRAMLPASSGGPPPTGPPATGSSPATAAQADGEVPGPLRRARRILSGPYAVAIISGLIVTVIGVVLTWVLTSPGGSPSAARPTGTGKPKAQTSSPSPSASVAPPLSAAECLGVRPPRTLPTSPHPPLAVITEDPMGILGTSYALPTPKVLSAAGLRRLDTSQDAGGPGSGDYLASIGGYAIGTNGTQVVVQNKTKAEIRILGIRAVQESCQAPLTGTLFENSSSGADLSINLGFDLDSPDSEARAIKGTVVSPSAPNYFDQYTVSIGPGKQQVFDLLAVTAKHAWSFRYQVTMLEGGTKVYQLIGDGAQPFRVTSALPIGRFYSVAYAGGIASPTNNLAWARVNPREVYVR